MRLKEKVTGKYRLSAEVYNWLLTLVRTSEEHSKALSITASSLIQRAKAYLKEHFAEPVTLDMLADHCEVNKYHLCRLFQKSEQTSPLSYLRDRRMEAAIAMLRTTKLPVREIGRRCGFDSPSYFGKVFCEYMSMTPKEYRLKKLEFPYDAIYYE